MFRTTVHATARTAMTAIAGIEKIGRPVRHRTTTHANNAGRPDEQKDVVDSRGGQVAVQQVVRHPEATARRTVPAGQKLERACGKSEVGTVWVGEADVGQGCRRAPRRYRARRRAVPAR